MGIELVPEKRDAALRLGDYLPEVEFRLANSQDELEEIYRLRYKAYLREQEIDPNPAERFTDYYDDMENCWIFGVYANDRLASSVRMHVISKQWRKGPALDVFPDVVSPLIEQGKMLIDPTRFVADEEANRKYPELAYVTLRAPSMACVAFDADYCLATVKAEYQPFYERIFNARALCEPRPYPALKHRIALMLIDVRDVRDGLMARHKAFHTTTADWHMLFDRSMQMRELGHMPPLVQMPDRLAS